MTLATSGFGCGAPPSPDSQGAPPFRLDDNRNLPVECRGPDSDTESDGDARESSESSVGSDNHAGHNYAVAWNDLHEWDYWNDLLTSGPPGADAWSSHATGWKFDVQNRFPVRVTDGDRPVAGVNVKLVSDDGDGIVDLVSGDDEVVWTARTGAHGRAELFAGAFSPDAGVPDKLLLYASKDGSTTIHSEVEKNASRIGLDLDTSTLSEPRALDTVFLFDQTQSMDEQLLGLVLDARAAAESLEARTENPDRLRWAGAGFKNGGNYQISRFDEEPRFVATQEFDDEDTSGPSREYREPITWALGRTINSVKWRSSATKIIVVVTDAGPPQSRTVIDKLEPKIRTASSEGIRVLTVAGWGMGAESEYLLRAISIATNGRYAPTFKEPLSFGGESRQTTVRTDDVTCLDNVLERQIGELADL